VRLAANPNYWRQGEPRCPEVVISIFSDNAAADAALESGQTLPFAMFVPKQPYLKVS
jgi:ABC-type transport system substrate-binding protein